MTARTCSGSFREQIHRQKADRSPLLSRPIPLPHHELRRFHARRRQRSAPHRRQGHPTSSSQINLREMLLGYQAVRLRWPTRIPGHNVSHPSLKAELSEPFVPQGVAGILTTTCACGWEIVSVVPEEADMRICLLFNHLREKHGIELPLLTCKQF